MLSRNTKIKLIVFIVASYALISFLPSKTYTREQQQKDFMKMYREADDIVYKSKKNFYTVSSLLTKIPKTNSYSLYKDSEDLYGKCSAYFTFSNFSIPESLKSYKKDIEQSLSELSTACVVLQEDAKYMADYINTNNLESYNKSKKQLEQQPIKLMANAMSRLVYGIGEKIGIDTKSLSEEYKNESNKIQQEFESQFGTPVK